ncbi:hypothetical protein CRG98_044111 [Punica granatum]|uniref:Uncharacterized protein n=1 Tax=Punica granatum TaxID=22663 RepID=A0A2I0HUX1_PUNGR|nr:hypothetical protein CRG98_044111 [Punica granatum]
MGHGRSTVTTMTVPPPAVTIGAQRRLWSRELGPRAMSRFRLIEAAIERLATDPLHRGSIPTRWRAQSNTRGPLVAAADPHLAAIMPHEPQSEVADHDEFWSGFDSPPIALEYRLGWRLAASFGLPGASRGLPTPWKTLIRP